MGKISYSDFVDYSKLDPVKRMALELFEPTLRHPERLGVSIPFLGETAAAFDLKSGINFTLTFNIEGLGTKNMIADEMWKEIKDPTLYSGLGKDNAAMSVNDQAGIGADVFIYGDIIASGDDNWYADEKRAKALLSGYRQAADEALFAIPVGETPTLRGIVLPETLDMAGASVGIIKPSSRAMGNGKKIVEGDRIFGLASSGIHSNGLSKARKISEKLPAGYFTKLRDGAELGRALLVPTTLYTRCFMDIFDAGVDVHYSQPITGHGWQKIMRAKPQFKYVIEQIPEPQLVFRQLTEWGEEHGFDISHEENYKTWNMGLGFVIFAPAEYEPVIKEVAERHKIGFYNLGIVKNGERSVIMEPLGIKY